MVPVLIAYPFLWVIFELLVYIIVHSLSDRYLACFLLGPIKIELFQPRKQLPKWKGILKNVTFLPAVYLIMNWYLVCIKTIKIKYIQTKLSNQLIRKLTEWVVCKETQ